MQTKTCNSCNELKPLDEFTRATAGNNFKSSRATHHTYCKVCNAARAKAWRLKHGSAYRGSGRVKSIPLEDRLLMSAIRHRLKDARSRCKKFGKTAPALTDLYLYELFLSQDRACALTGAPLVFDKDHPLCLSLDQKDPGKGYIEGNVQWLAWAVNRAKGDLSSDHFYEMCEVVLEHRKAQRLSTGSES
jgi:hypothetical protein